jgi:putative transposase
VTPTAKRQAIAELRAAPHCLSAVRACRAVGLSRAAYYRPTPDPVTRDGAVITALQAVVTTRTRWGFWKCFDALRLEGHPWNHKRVHRVYCALRLNLPRRTRRRLPQRPRVPLDAQPELNRTWTLDFMTDLLYDGRQFRTLNVLDEGNREGLAIEIGLSLPSTRVIAVLEDLIAWAGAPQTLRVDNGPEFVSHVFVEWCARRTITIHYIQPGKPAQNAYIERFNRTYRTEILDAHIFGSLADVRELTRTWLVTYNTQRPHDSLGRVPPLTYLPRPIPIVRSPFDLSP